MYATSVRTKKDRYFRGDERFVWYEQSVDLVRLLECAVETRNWALVAICRDRLQYLSYKARQEQ